MTRERLRVALSIGVLVALAVYAFAVRPLEAAIAVRYADIDAERARMENDRLIARQLQPLIAQQRQLEAHLRRRHLHDSRAILIDRFLRSTARVAEQNHIAVRTIVPGSEILRAPAAEPMEELHLDLTVRGPYGAVIRTMRDLSDSDVAAELTVAAIGNPDRRALQAPQLNATFHVTLFRESDAATIHAPHSV